MPDLLPQQVQDATRLVGQTVIGSFSRAQASMIQGDPDIGTKLKPNLALDLTGHPDYDYRGQTISAGFDDVGFRGIDEPDEPVYGVAVGDSFTFAVGVNDDETWVYHLSQLSEAHLSIWDFLLLRPFNTILVSQ